MWKLLLISTLFLATLSAVKTRKIDHKIIIDRHNYYRKMVGVENIQYSDECAAKAQRWAEYLAQKNDGLFHSKSNKYGENIYWKSASTTEQEVVDLWGSEKSAFNKRKRTYNHASGHYSQVVWRKTKFVGAGMAIAKDGSEYWVCTYYPAGNYIGEKAY